MYYVHVLPCQNSNLALMRTLNLIRLANINDNMILDHGARLAYIRFLKITSALQGLGKAPYVNETTVREKWSRIMRAQLLRMRCEVAECVCIIILILFPVFAITSVIIRLPPTLFNWN